MLELDAFGLPMQSPLSQGRELKLLLPLRHHAGAHVAPLAGAGIEIIRWLKSSMGSFVAPLAGAGIEIWRSASRTPLDVVAPLAGAGIEIVVCNNVVSSFSRRPSRRGGN